MQNMIYFIFFSRFESKPEELKYLVYCMINFSIFISDVNMSAKLNELISFLAIMINIVTLAHFNYKANLLILRPDDFVL